MRPHHPAGCEQPGQELQRERHVGLRVEDVRREDEWEEGHLEGAVHHSLIDMGGLGIDSPVEGLPTDRELWVHCAGGFRASVAASLLARAGYRVVAIDDSFDNAADGGFEITA